MPHHTAATERGPPMWGAAILAGAATERAPPGVYLAAGRASTFSGMLAATFVGIFFTPALYALFQRLREWVKRLVRGSARVSHRGSWRNVQACQQRQSRVWNGRVWRQRIHCSASFSPLTALMRFRISSRNAHGSHHFP